MRRPILLLPAFFLNPAATSLGQESLCDPCVDVPSRLHQPYRLTGPDTRPFEQQFEQQPEQRETTIIRAEDMRELGVVPVSEMMRQLPSNLTTSTCPVTRVAAGPSFTFDGAASGWSSALWFGSRSFSVNLREDGTYNGGDKFFWYSQGFEPEQASELQVEIRRLDAGPVTATALEPTNALFDGRWHMLTGISFPDAGCWEITGTWRGQTLTFVVESLAD